MAGFGKLALAALAASLLPYEVKKDADGALNYSVTITALVYTDESQVDHMYKIIGDTPTE